MQNRWKILGSLLLLFILLSMIALSDRRSSEIQYPNIWKTKADAIPTNTTSMPIPPKPAAPGLESIFAIIGLMAVAYLVLGKKQQN
jgi:hypothetical protein